MRAALAVPILAAVAVAGALGGYGFAYRQLAPATPTAATASAPSPSAPRKVLYYKDPMGKPDFSPVPKKDSMGMDYLPVYEDEEAPLASAAAPPSPPNRASPASAAAGGPRKILYYRNPMGLADTSPTPKQDAMGMDYLPVYADDAGDDGGVVTVSPARVQMLGVRSEPAARRTLIRPVRAVGTVQFSERQISVVSTRFEGWVEALHVNATGEAVRRGEPLMRVYSPLLVQTQQEYVDAAKMAVSLAAADDDSRISATRLMDGAVQRLRSLDFPDAELRRLQREQRVSRTVTWPAPFSGVVLEKTVFDGMRFMPGEPLYRIAGLSPIWVIAEVFEQDLASVAVGQPATVSVKAYPGRSFRGRVAFIYPSVGAETRTGRIRIELPNPGGELKADMYAGVELDTRAAAAPVLSVPDSAVIDNGVRQVVLIQRGEGRFEPRSVTLGARADGFTEIRSGVAEGENVVVSATFLIDAESNLKAALSAFTAGEPPH